MILCVKLYAIHSPTEQFNLEVKNNILEEDQVFPANWKTDPRFHFIDKRTDEFVSPDLTIITITYNCLKFVEYTIDNVIRTKSKHTKIEHVVVDGGSTDGTFDKLATCDSIDVLVSGPDAGISEAFNRGLYLARGRLVSILNAGDAQTPNCLDDVLLSFREGADLIYGSSYRTDLEYGLPIGMVQSADWVKKENGTPFLHGAVFMTRALYRRVGGYDSRFRYAMDIDLLYRAFERSDKIIRLDTVLTLQREGGVSHQQYKSALKEYYSINCERSKLSNCRLKLIYYKNYFRYYCSSV